MKLEQTFDVQAPIDAVWRALNDLERIGPCLPGAQIVSNGDGTYDGAFTLRLGFLNPTYRGTIAIESTDEAARVSRLAVTGANGSATGATVVNTLSEQDGGATRVESVAELSVDDRFAWVADSGMVQDLSQRLLSDFATCLASRLADLEPPRGEDITAGAAPVEAANQAQPGAGPTPPAPSGAEVTAGDAAPEEVIAAAPDAQDPPDPDSAAASA